MQTKLADDVTKAIPAIQAQALGRLQEATEKIERGEFAAAQEDLHTAQHRLARLVWMEQNVAGFAHSMVVKVRQVQPGMTLAQWGVISEAEDGEHACEAGNGIHHTRTLRFESGFEVVLNPDDEVMVENQ